MIPAKEKQLKKLYETYLREDIIRYGAKFLKKREKLKEKNGKE
jgi:hypothetical protein